MNNGYELQPTEKTLFMAREDTCTPNAMTDLLKLILFPEPGTWMEVASKIICHLMAECKTGENLLPAALEGYQSDIESFGHKTGGLGSIRNDAGFVRFKDGKVLLIAAFVSNSALPLKTREEFLNAYLRDVINNTTANYYSAEPRLSPVR